ncbi:class I SAM-dependent methyltransferase, partial [Actinomadura sp. WAC 06369]
MPHPATVVPEIAPHLKRLLDFVDPQPGDVCLDVARGRGPLPALLAPRVRRLTAVDAARDGRAFRTGPVPSGCGPAGTATTSSARRS